MSLISWIIFLTLAFVGYSTWYIVSNWARFKELYRQLYEEKQVIARRYLKEKQGFDKI